MRILVDNVPDRCDECLFCREENCIILDSSGVGYMYGHPVYSFKRSDCPLVGISDYILRDGIEFTYDDCPTCGNKKPNGGCRYSNICTVNVVEDGVRIGAPSHWIEKIN